MDLYEVAAEGAVTSRPRLFTSFGATLRFGSRVSSVSHRLSRTLGTHEDHKAYALQHTSTQSDPLTFATPTWSSVGGEDYIEPAESRIPEIRLPADGEEIADRPDALALALLYNCALGEDDVRCDRISHSLLPMQNPRGHTVPSVEDHERRGKLKATGCDVALTGAR
jgi:hypothetical protein